MSMNIKSQLLILAIITLSLSGCGLFGDKEEDQPVYFEASETDYLSVPKGLNEPRRDQALVIMGDSSPGQTIASSEPPRVQSMDSSGNLLGGINYGSRGSYLLIQDSMGSVYERLKVAIESVGMELLDENSTESTHDLYYADSPRPQQKKGFFKSMLFWRKAEVVDYSGNYRTRLESDSTNTRIYLLDMQGENTSEGAADAILSQILEGLG